MPLRVVLVLLLAVLLPQSAAGEVYTWTDEGGRVHMTDDLSNVPPEHRRRAEEEGREVVEPPPRWNEVEGGSEWKTLSAPPAGSAPGAPRVHVLRVDRAGREMRVNAELDGGVVVPFVVDTGAMGCTIPEWAVREMGIEFDEDTPSMLIRGISGKPMLVPVITVRSVRVGEAEVEDVEMAVLSTQNSGLLGMTFFNHFKVQTDPAGGTLTLEEIDLESVEGVYGGLGEQAWRSKFAYVHWMLENIRGWRGHVPDGFEEYARRIDEVEDYWERQLDELELRASRAGVPRAWRE